VSGDIIWRRLSYMLSPQLDLYRNIGPLLRRQDVLEVGFGTGHGTLQLARHAATVKAVEIDPEMVKFARNTLPLANVTWMEHDILEGGNFRGVYHAVVMVEVLEHIHDWQRALAHVHELLRVGGSLYITARNANADLRRNELHEREWSAAELVKSLGYYFDSVRLFDYTLKQGLGADTRTTPLIAVATKGNK
jgi:2-polyprenyl-3-methyl-5-hydroxy-6-metoxy-1,4-benzoquinol methylase